MRSCKIKGCTYKHLAQGYCNRHYLKLQRHGDPLYIRPEKIKGCLIEGCNREHESKRYCSLHYGRFLKHGDPLYIYIRKKEKKICSVNECNTKRHTKLYCLKHHRKFKKYGDPLYVAKEKIRCSIKECNKLTHNNGLCVKHYTKFEKYGDPLFVKPKKIIILKHKIKRPEKCSIDNCNKSHFALNYCAMHYTRFKKHGDPNYVPPIKEKKIIIKEKKEKQIQCSIDNCEKIKHSLGYCQMHYKRFIKYGDAYPLLPPRVKQEPQTCSINNCNKIAKKKDGLCNAHYHRLTRYGDPLHDLRPKSLYEAFLKYVNPNGDGCWLWLGSITKNGYGGVHFKHKTYRAHRVSYMYFHGPIKVGNVIMHSCDNKLCINPAHLSQGTDLDNIQDRQNKNRQAKGSQNGKSKLNEQKVLEIRKRLKEEKLKNTSIHKPYYHKIAKEFDVSHTTISSIDKKKLWGHV